MLPRPWTWTNTFQNRLSHSLQQQRFGKSYSTATTLHCARKPALASLVKHRIGTLSASRTVHYRTYTTGSSAKASKASPSSLPPTPCSEDDTLQSSENDRATSEKLRRVLRKVPFPVVVVSTVSPQDPSVRRGITVSSFTSISLQPIPLIAFCVKLPSKASTLLHESNRFVIQFLSSDQIPHSVAFSSSVSPPPGTGAGSSEAINASTKGSTSPASSTIASTAASKYPRASRKEIPQDKDIEDLVSEASRQTLIENTTIAGTANSDNEPELMINVAAATATPTSTSTEATDLDPFEVLGYETEPESNLPVLLNTMGAIRCRTHQVMAVGDHEMWIGHVEKVLHGEFPDTQQQPLLYHDRSYRKVGRRIL
ncbi:hypothetical protein BG011_000281 [Mortierella polycephala]|uniref:Flavin reductase like domain-containing protein n=1 Tax=Mortierella polycephala TaxID=41804 RepID=A0A9P6QBR1_9FUNG|nr:hypothetical protein BG011_000281 [Mortierella polycephala]